MISAGTEPGLAGTVIITPLGPNQVKVDVRVTGLKPNDERIDHIHSPGPTATAPCDTGGPVVYPFTNVKADANGVGTSTTTVTFDPAKGIPGPGWYVNVHQGLSGAGVICAKIPATLGSAAAAPAAAAPAAAAPAAAVPAALPRTGTGGPAPSPVTLIVALVLAGFALGGAGLSIARPR